jgi:hypothetical protein
MLPVAGSAQFMQFYRASAGTQFESRQYCATMPLWGLLGLLGRRPHGWGDILVLAAGVLLGGAIPLTASPWMTGSKRRSSCWRKRRSNSSGRDGDISFALLVGEPAGRAYRRAVDSRPRGRLGSVEGSRPAVHEAEDYYNFKPYIRQNPIKRGLATALADYSYSFGAARICDGRGTSAANAG